MVSAEDITGTWKLVARGASESQKAQLEERYGTQSEGVVILSPDGWMCAALGRGDRAIPTGTPMPPTPTVWRHSTAMFPMPGAGGSRLAG